jgi:hypothetical protein
MGFVFLGAQLVPQSIQASVCREPCRRVVWLQQLLLVPAVSIHLYVWPESEALHLLEVNLDLSLVLVWIIDGEVNDTLNLELLWLTVHVNLAGHPLFNFDEDIFCERVMSYLCLSFLLFHGLAGCWLRKEVD